MNHDRLLDTIYSAPFDVNGWQAVCDQVSELANAVGSALVCSRPELRPLNMIYSDSMSALIDEYVADYWYLRDARNIGLRNAGLSGSFFVNGYVTDGQLFTPEQMKGEPFYADLLTRHGLKWYCGFLIGDSSNWSVLSINRGLHADPFSLNEVQLLMPYARHISRSARIAGLANFTAIEDALQKFEDLSIPAIAIDAKGVVRTHNILVDEILGHGLSLRQGRLVCERDDDQLHLDKLITQLATVDVTKYLTDPVIIRRRNGAVAFSVRGCPLVGPAADIFSGLSSILLMQSMRPSPKRVAKVLQQRFGLSPRQAQLTEQIANGRSLKEAAEQMCITHATARDHLKAVFRRTGTNRQAELVGLVSRLTQ